MDYAYKKLKQKYDSECDENATGVCLRLQRALSWLKRAEMCDDIECRFINLWISFNAAYAQETRMAQLSDGQQYNDFIRHIVSVDVDHQLHQYLWRSFSQTIRVLLDNHFVFQPFWGYQNGLEGYEDWQESFIKAKHSAHLAIMNKDTSLVLSIIFSRLYTLRNQVIHGGITWGGECTQQQFHDAAKLLGDLVPMLLQIMIEHPNQMWGEPSYRLKRAAN